MLRLAIQYLLCTGALVSLPVLSGDLDQCVGMGTDVARAACLLDTLGDQFPDEREFRSLEKLATEAPAPVLSLLDTLEGQGAAGKDPAPERVARLLDLRGRALLALGRYEEAAEVYSESLLLDDGTLRLTWLSPTIEEVWASSLDVGNGRLVRGAQSMIRSGRGDDSRELLARALSLGENGSLTEIWGETGGGSLPTLDPSPSPLFAEDWYKKVPDIELELHGGGSYALNRDRKGKVLILSFWASWCVPCGHELPKLQALFDLERDRGLETLAVNVGDSPAEVASYFEALGLSLPSARSIPAAEEFFDAKSLPVVAVIDARHRVRGRWVGFKPKFAEEIHALSRKILDEPGPPGRSVGEVLLGGGQLRVAWTREAPGRVEGLAVTPRGAREQGVLVAAGRSMVLYGENGATRRTWTSPASIGRLKTTPSDEEGSYTAVGFRPGSKTWMSFEMPVGTPFKGTAAAPVFDVDLTSAAAGGGAPSVLLATSEGLARAPSPTSAPVAVPGIPGGTSAVSVLDEGEHTRLAVLEFGGRLVLLDLQGELVPANVPGDAWTLVGAGGLPGAGFGVAPSGVIAATTGSFLDGGGFQVAVATATGQLVILDGESGRPLVRVRWPGLRALSAGDLTGDNRDELVAAGGAQVVVVQFSTQ